MPRRNCEHCQSDSQHVSERRTTRGQRTLCAYCYGDVLADGRLSPREGEVYALKDSGYSNEEVAAELGIDSSTIGTHVASIREKYMQADDLMKVIEPAALPMPPGQHRRAYEGEPPHGLTPGATVVLNEPNVDTSECEYEPQHPDFDSDSPYKKYTHGIVRRVLTRSKAGVPTRVSVYPFNPDTGEVRMLTGDSPAVVDMHVDSIDTVIPADTTNSNQPLSP